MLLAASDELDAPAIHDRARSSRSQTLTDNQTVTNYHYAESPPLRATPASPSPTVRRRGWPALRWSRPRDTRPQIRRSPPPVSPRAPHRFFTLFTSIQNFQTARAVGWTCVGRVGMPPLWRNQEDDSWLTCGCERAGRLRKRPPKSTWGHAGVQGTGGADGREQKWYRRHTQRERELGTA